MARIHPLNTTNFSKPIAVKKEKTQSFLELKVQKTEENFFIPEWQKEIVRNRIANSKDSDFTSLEDAFKKLKLE